MRREYRVRWQREGRQRTSHMFQTLKGAQEKRDRLIQLEDDKHLTDWERAGGPAYDAEDIFVSPNARESNRFEDMPDLIGEPEIECRVVGEWEPLPSVERSAGR